MFMQFWTNWVKRAELMLGSGKSESQVGRKLIDLGATSNEAFLVVKAARILGGK